MQSAKLLCGYMYASAGEGESTSDVVFGSHQLIAENGTPGEVQLAESSGSASLDEAALAALRRWRFQPALRDGQPVLAWVTVPVIFSLR